MMPAEVMIQARDEFLNWQQTGTSIAEISHRSQPFVDLAAQAESDLRDILKIPHNYHVLFLSGGARTQFSSIPMNLMDQFQSAAYVQTGLWSAQAAAEASRYLSVKTVSNTKTSEYKIIPAQSTWSDFSDCAYLHYTDNETVQGIEFDFVPDTQGVPLVCDMSSNLLSRPIDISKYGLIYACAQKNISIAGVTIVIIRDDLLKRTPHAALPSIMNYSAQVKHRSMLNTPATFSWYLAGLMFQWIKGQGGVPALSKQNIQKSKKLYQYLDAQDFYQNTVDPKFRSRMNIVFTLPTKTLEAEFIAAAEDAKLIGLQGHRTMGGIRVSLYNAMPLSGVERLIEFMQCFHSRL